MQKVISFQIPTRPLICPENLRFQNIMTDNVHHSIWEDFTTIRWVSKLFEKNLLIYDIYVSSSFINKHWLQGLTSMFSWGATALLFFYKKGVWQILAHTQFFSSIQTRISVLIKHLHVKISKRWNMKFFTTKHARKYRSIETNKKRW